MLLNRVFIETLLVCGLLLGFMPVSYAAETPAQVEPAQLQAEPVQAQQSQTEKPQAQEPTALGSAVGRVVWVKGDFKAYMPDREARILKKDSVIYVHDKLVTGKNTQAQIVFTDNTLMTFRDRTEFVIKEYSYNPKAKGKSVGKYVMNLIEGGFRTITGLIAKKNPADYAVETPVATIGVRGTDYTVYFRAGEMFIGYDKGLPCVTSKKKEGQSLCLDKENKYAKVDVEGVPVPLEIRPDFLGPVLEIVPATMKPISSPNYSPNETTVRQLEPNNVVNSFCIT